MKHVIQKSQLVEEAQGAYKSNMETLAERLLEEKYTQPEYADIALGIDEVYAEPMTRRRAINTIIKMDNQERFFEDLSRYLSEETFTANFGATPQAIIRSIRVANPNSIIEDIADVQTISSMVGMIGYIKPVFSRSIRGATAGDLLVESKAKDYGSENLDQAIATTTATTTYTSTLTYLPIRRGTVTVVLDGVEIGKDDGNGNIIPAFGMSLLAGTTGTNDIDYTTGIINLEFITATPVGKVLLINYNYDTEQNTNAHGDIELVWVSDGVRAEMHPLNFKFSLTSMLLGQSANFSVEEVLNDAATQYLKAERDRIGVEYNSRLARANVTITFNASPSAGGDNNNKMRAQMLELTIEQAANAMYEAKNRGGVTYLIAGSSAAAYMNLLDNFVKDASQSPIGCYRIGYLGKAPVIKARVNDLATNEILVGYKSEWGEAPFIHADYLDYATETLTLSSFISQRGLASYYKNVRVEPSFVRRISISSLPA